MTFAAALLLAVFGRENVWLLSIFGITGVLGTTLVISTSAARLYRGDVKLRPWDAAKKAIEVFILLLALRLLAWVVFPSLHRDLTKVAAESALFAIVYGLYTTAYRKPA